MNGQRSAPLAGITVLEVGVFIAAPYATMQLADLGARVLKIENPGEGDPVRAAAPFVEGEGSAFLRLNRNKESVALDLKSAAGRDAFLRLAGQADVLVENLRPGAMRRLGLGYEDVRALNPGIVYASASGWGQDGPLASLAGLDIMAQARSGLMSVTGEPEGDPAKVGVPVCDLVCALYVSLAVTAALRERDLSGQGQHIDVSLLESGVSLAVWEAGKYFATGEVGGRSGSAHQASAPYQAVRTADGHVTVGATTPKTWTAFCAALDLPELLEDERYTDGSARHTHLATLLPVIEEATTARTTAELVRLLEDAGVPCSPIHDYGQVFADEHLRQREYFWDAPHAAAGSAGSDGESGESAGIRQLGSPMRLSETPVRQDAAGPALGEHTEAVLREFGAS